MAFLRSGMIPDFAAGQKTAMNQTMGSLSRRDCTFSLSRSRETGTASPHLCREGSWGSGSPPCNGFSVHDQRIVTALLAGVLDANRHRHRLRFLDFLAFLD